MSSPDGPNDDNGGERSNTQAPQSQGRNFGYANKMRSQVEGMQRQAQAVHDRIQGQLPDIKEQTRRLIQDHPSPPLYAKLWMRSWGSMAASLNATLRVHNDTRLTDEQAAAVVDAIYKVKRDTARLDWASFAGVAALTSRRLGINTPPPVLRNGGWGRRTWPVLLFLTYLAPIELIVMPACSAYLLRRHVSKLESHPAMAGLRFDTYKLRLTPEEGGSMPGQHQDEQPSIPQQAAPAWNEYTQPSQVSEAASTSNWDQYRQPSSQASQQQASSSQESNNSWGSSSSWDDDDDASPIAPSARGTLASSGGGSSWDRLRQQTRPQQSPRNAPPQQSQETWGASSGSNQEYPSSRDGYSYPGSNNVRNTSKDRAQEDFDRLLERERRGTGEDRTSWSGK